MNAGAALTRRWLSLPPRRCAVRHQTEWVALSDGVRLATQLVLPQDGARAWPAVLIRTLAAAHAPGHPAAALGRLVAESGYAVVLQECRGRHASEGSFAPFLHEAADGGDAIAWTLRQPWFDGRLALAGWGYSGFAAWAALSRSPRPVAALVAAFAARDPLALLRPGGALALELALRWGVGIGQREPHDPRRLDLERGLGHRPLREADRVTLRRVDWFRDWIDHPARDAYWEARIPALPEAPPPALLIAGWRHPALAAQLADFGGAARARAAGGRAGARAGDRPLARGPAAATAGAPHPQPGGRREPARRPRLPRAPPARRAGGARAGARVRARRRGLARGVRLAAPGRRGVGAAPARRRPRQRAHRRRRARARSAGGRGARRRLLLRPARSGARRRRRGGVPRRRALLHDGEAARRRCTLAGPGASWCCSRRRAPRSPTSARRWSRSPRTERAQTLCDGVLRSRGAPGATRRLELDLGAACARLEPGQRLRLAVSSSAFPRWDRPSHTEVEPGLAADEQVAPARQTVFHDRERPSHVLLSLLRS